MSGISCQNFHFDPWTGFIYRKEGAKGWYFFNTIPF